MVARSSVIYPKSCEAVRRGINRWSSRAARRGWLRVIIVGLAGIGLLPVCLSIIAVYFGHVMAPAYQTEAWLAGLAFGVVLTIWLVVARTAPVASSEADPSPA